VYATVLLDFANASLDTKEKGASAKHAQIPALAMDHAAPSRMHGIQVPTLLGTKRKHNSADVTLDTKVPIAL